MQYRVDGGNTRSRPYACPLLPTTQVVTAWNGMGIGAFALASRALAAQKQVGGGGGADAVLCGANHEDRHPLSRAVASWKDRQLGMRCKRPRLPQTWRRLFRDADGGLCAVVLFHVFSSWG